MIPKGSVIDLKLGVEHQSLATVQLLGKRRGHTISQGTGFFVRDADGQLGVFTCWHVVTGRKPENPELLLPNLPDSPDAMSVGYVGLDGMLREVVAPLYRGDRSAVWLERPLPGIRPDCVLLPVGAQPHAAAINDTLKNEFSLPGAPTIERSEPEDILRVSSAVFVLGYPELPSQRGSPFPIWKSGTIASEPKLKKSTYLIDATTNNGFSGGPVLCDTGKISNMITLSKALRLDIVGIYSSHIVHDKYDPSIGVAWKMSAAPWFDSPQGSNPYAPDID